MQNLKQDIKNYVKTKGDATPKTYIEKVRKVLCCLLCQSDKIESSGNVEDFGGSAAVQSDIGRAVLNLFALAEKLEVDVFEYIEKKVYPKADGQPGSKDKPIDAAVSAAPEDIPKQDTQGPSGADSKTKEMYEKALRDAKSKEERANVWKEITSNKALSNTEKVALQTVKRDLDKKS